MLVHFDGGVLIPDRLEVGVRADRGRCADHADAPVARRERRRRRAGADHPQDRQVVAAAQVAERDRGRGVAGDDHGLDVTLDEGIDRLGRKRAHLLVGPHAIWGARVVAEVDGRLVRAPPEDLAQHGQATHARVEDTDGSWIGHPGDDSCNARSTLDREVSWRQRAPGERRLARELR